MLDLRHVHDTLMTRTTIRGQKEKQKEKENKKQQLHYPYLDNDLKGENPPEFFLA